MKYFPTCFTDIRYYQYITVANIYIGALLAYTINWVLLHVYIWKSGP